MVTSFPTASNGEDLDAEKDNDQDDNDEDIDYEYENEEDDGEDISLDIQEISEDLATDLHIGDWVAITYERLWYPGIIQKVI